MLCAQGVGGGEGIDSEVAKCLHTVLSQENNLMAIRGYLVKV